MDQIVSLPDLAWNEHRKGLELISNVKSFDITNIGGFYQSMRETPSPLPQLLIVDHSVLHDVVNHITSQDFGEPLRKIPVVEIFDRDYEDNVIARENQRWAPYLNIVHCMTIEEQFTPNNFCRIVRALDIAQEKGPVTMEAFQSALALVSGSRNTSLDTQSRSIPARSHDRA